MPHGTSVDRVYQALVREGKDQGTAARIAQAQTGLSLQTGKKPKRKKRAMTFAQAFKAFDPNQPRDPKTGEWIDEDGEVLERPVRAALRVGDRVFTGAIHALSQDAAERALGKPAVDAIWDKQFGFGDNEGFVTNRGRFVTRRQANDLLAAYDESAEVGRGEMHSSQLREKPRPRKTVKGYPDQPRDDHGRWTAGALTRADLQQSAGGTGGVPAIYDDISGTLNTGLRAGALSLGGYASRYWHANWIKTIDTDIGAWTSKVDGTVWRMIPHEVLASLSTGDVLLDKAFVSVSARSLESSANRQHPRPEIMDIFVPAGTNIAPVDDRPRYEFLLPRGTRFEYLGGTKFRVLPHVAKGYPDQPRDDDGRWTAGGSGLSYKEAYRTELALKRRFPDARVVTVTSNGDGSSLSVIVKSGQNSLSFVTPGRTHAGHLYFGGIEAYADEVGYEGFAREALRTVMEAAHATKATHIDLYAVATGSYLWPKLGFELRATDAGHFLTSAVVAAHLQRAEAVLPAQEWSKVVAAISERDPLLPHRLANLGHELSLEDYRRINGDYKNAPVGKLTLGKALLHRSGGVDYTLPKSKFDVLEKYARMHKVAKEDDQPRVPAGSPEGGQWTDGGAGTAARERRGSLDARRMSEGELRAALQSRMSEHRATVIVRGDYPRAFRIEINPSIGAGLDGGGSIFQVRDDGKEVSAGYMKVPDTHDGKRLARAIMGALRDFATASGVEVITTEAGMSMGGYVWPRIGFDLVMDGSAETLKWRLDKRSYQLFDAKLITQAEFAAIDAILGSWDATAPTRITQLGRRMQLTPEQLYQFSNMDIRGRQTIGKVLLAGTQGNYELPRAKFARLGKSEDFDKGYPEYQEQERDESGKWTDQGGGGRKGTLDINVHTSEELEVAIKQRHPNFFVDIGDGYPDDFILHLGDPSIGATSSFSVFDAGKRIDAGLLDAPATAEGSRAALGMMHVLRDVAIASGTESIDVHAGLQHGGYFWPRLGFELDPKNYNFVHGDVTTRTNQLHAMGLITQEQRLAVEKIVMDWGPTSPTKIAHLNDPVKLTSDDQLYHVTGYKTTRGKERLGKLLLAGTNGYYTLPRAKFNSLGSLTKSDDGWMFALLFKGDPDQPREPAGRPEGGQWTAEGGGASAIAVQEVPARGVSPFDVRGQRAVDLERNLKATLPPGFDVQVDPMSVWGTGSSPSRNRDISILKLGPDGRYISSSSFKISRRGIMTAELLQADNTAEGQAASIAIMRAMYNIAVDSGVEKIKLDAGLQHGGYFWPRLGFDLTSKAQVDEFVGYVTSNLHTLYGHIKDSTYNEIKQMLLEARVTGDVTIAARIAQRNDPLPTFSTSGPDSWMHQRLQDMDIRGRQTVSKFLMRIGGMGNYELPRAKFHILAQFVRSTRKRFDKGDPDQPRDDHGRWTDGGGMTLSGAKMLEYRSSWRDDPDRKPAVYDPDYFSLESDTLRNEAGAVIAERSKLVPRRGISDYDIIASGPDIIHRGMSHGEYQEFLRTGVIRSKGTHNIGDAQKGLTYYTTEPASAASYASSFAPAQFKPAPGRDAYVVSIRLPSADRIVNVPGIASHEIGVAGPVPASDVVAVYRGRVIAYTPEYNGPGFKSAASSWLHWEAFKAFDKGDPDQPRVPAGSPEGGQWAAEGGGGTAPAGGSMRAMRMGNLKSVSTEPDAAAIVQEWFNTGDLLNLRLRHPTGMLSADKERVANMDRVVASHVVETTAIVWRGVNEGFAASLAELNPGDTITSPSYVSTSSRAQMAAQFANKFDPGAIMELVVEPGVNIAPIDALKPKGAQFFAENEYVLPRNTTLVYVSKRSGPGGSVPVYRFRVLPEVAKGDPDQPRAPAGTPEGGQWVAEGGGGTAAGGKLDYTSPATIESTIKARLPFSVVQVREFGGGWDVLASDNVNVVSFFAPKGGGPLTFEQINTATDAGGRDYARAALQIVLDSAQLTGASAIRLEAAGAGAYVWPNAGFELDPNSPFGDPVAAFLKNSGIEERIKRYTSTLGFFERRAFNRMISEGGLDLPTRLAGLDTPITADQMSFIAGKAATRYTAQARGTPKLTLGKALLIGAKGHYALPRAKFGVLQRYINRTTT